LCSDSELSEWDKLCEIVGNIEGDLSDIGFMIEFSKIWNMVKHEGDKNQQKLEEIRMLMKESYDGEFEELWNGLVEVLS